MIPLVLAAIQCASMHGVMDYPIRSTVRGFFEILKINYRKNFTVDYKPQKKRLILRYVELLRKKCIKKIKKKDFLIFGFTRKEKS